MLPIKTKVCGVFANMAVDMDWNRKTLRNFHLCPKKHARVPLCQSAFESPMSVKATEPDAL